MSIPRRIFRVAVEKLKEGIGADDAGGSSWTGRRRTAGDARRELEEFLNSMPGGAPPPPPRPRVDPLAADYALLGVPPDADAETLRSAWRRCVRDNHPDRFSGDPAAQAAAGERFLKFQAAYERITAARSGR